MRSFWALLFLAALQTIAAVPHPAFDANKEYVYQYRSRAVTGIKEDVNQFAGVGFETNVYIQSKDNEVYFRFDDSKMGTFNQKFQQQFEGQEFPVNYKEIPKNPETAFLNYPFSAVFENGVVKTIKFHPKDSINSINTKKGLLSAFQMDLQGTKRVHRLGLAKDDVPTKRSKNVFRVKEEAVSGNCDTAYEIYSVPSHYHPQEAVLNVTKNRLYSNCLDRPYYYHSNRRGYKCESCPETQEKHAYRQTATTYYKIKGAIEDYTIERIYHSSRYILNPFSTYGKTVVHGINMTMFLTEVHDIQTPMTLPADAKTHDTLLYTVPHNEQDPEHKDLTRAHYHQRDYKDYKNQFDTYFKVLMMNFHYTDDVKQHDITGKYTELIHLTESLNFDELKELFNAHANYDPASATPEQKYEQTLFWDIISNVGTGPSFLLIKHAYENKKVDNKAAEHLIASYPYHCKEPSEKVVEEFINFVKNLPHAPYNSLTSTSVMAVGHMINKAVNTRNHYQHPREHKNYMSREVAKQHFKKIYERFLAAQTKWERMIYLATIQNMGLEESFPYMKEVITDAEHKYSTLERITAIYTLVKLTPKLRLDVIPLLMPIYRNRLEHYHLRLAAFNLIMKSKPSYELMYSLGMALRYDHSQEVQSYVYSTYQSMANFSWPCARPMREHARSVLELIPSYDYGYGYSKNLVFDFHDEKYNYGGFYQVAYTGAKDSIIPDSFHTKLTANVMGWNFDHFEFGVRTQGLSGIKERLFGSEGHFDSQDVDKSMLNIFKRHPRNTNAVEKELQEIETALKFQHTEEPKEKSFLIYFKALGQVVKMHYFDENIFNKLATPDNTIPLPAELIKMVQNGIPINFRRITHFADMHVEFPNEVGMPIIADMKIPMMVSLKGNVKANFVPGFFSEDRNGKKLTSMNVHLDLSAVNDYQLIARFGFVTPLNTNFGFGFTNEGIVKMPIRGDLEYNFHEKKYTGKMKATDKPYEVYSMKTTPFTYIHDHTSLTPLPEEKNSVTVQTVEKLMTQEKTIFKDAFGNGLKFERKTDNHELLYKGVYNSLHGFITKYGQFFGNNEHGYTNTLAKKVVSGLLYNHFTKAFTPKMAYFEHTITYEPDTKNPVTDYEETMQLNYSPQYHKPTLAAQNLEKDGKDLVATLTYNLACKGAVERKFHADWKFVIEPYQYTVKKVNFNYKRSAIPNYDSNSYMMCYNGVRKVPTDWTDFKSEQKSVLDATLRYGKDCDSGAKITINAIAEQSDAQKELIKNSQQHPMVRKCEEYKKKGVNYHDSCIRVMNYFLTPRHYVMDIKYENVPKSTHKILHKLEHYMQHKFYSVMTEHTDEATNEANHIKIEETIHPTKPFFHLHIYTPTTTTKYDYIYWPKYAPMLQLWHPYYNTLNLYKKAFFKHDFYPYCQVGGNFVSTFDQVEYEFPQTNCWQLLTKDATNDDDFSILYKEIKHNTYHKALKAIFGKHKLEILPVDESSPLIVRIDGAKQDVKDNEEFLFWDPEHPNSVLFSVEKKVLSAGTWYFVRLPRYHMELYYSGNEISVKASQHSRNRVLGLCGNFNAEKHGDLVGPDHCVYRNPLNFAYSYSVNADGCTIPAHEHEC